MAKLILGPLLRRVTGDRAVLWFQTDAPARIRVRAGSATGEASTEEFQGVHLAWVVVRGLAPGDVPYQVDVEGEFQNETVWPLDDRFPPSVIRSGTGPDATITFGSCREPNDYGADALEVFAKEVIAGDRELPDALALIGDQIYADELSPATKEWLAQRERPAYAPPDQVVTFEEYVHLYHENWLDPAVRWLLSTVPTYMIFDDHEIMDDWNSSASWLADMQTKPWWSERIAAGLTSYHLFQHAGNLPPEEMDPHTLPTRWSFTVDIGRTRLIMLDCRGSRVLNDPVRRMFPQEDWDWLAEQTKPDCDHLVLACSLPWLLAPIIHHVEGTMEILSHRLGGLMERLRRRYDLEHWSAVGHSFDELTELIASIDHPATVKVLGGDVHHSYVADALIPNRPRVQQVVCSPLNNRVSGAMKALLRLGWVSARLTGRDVGVRWKPLMRPYFGNAIVTLVHNGRESEVLLEGATATGELTTIYPSSAARR